MSLLNDPRLINYLMLILQALAVCRWAYARSWPDVWYWVFAFGISYVVTFMYER